MSAASITPTPSTTLQAAQANVLASVTAECTLLNANLKTIYLDTFDNWAQNVQNGAIPNTNPPQPPSGYIVGYYDDPTASGVQWPFPSQTGPAVCAQPPVPAPPPPTPSQPIFQGNGSVMNVPPGDTLPVGSIVTDAQGQQWQKTASPTPFGVAYYYAKVA